MEKRLVTIARFNNIIEAHVSQGILESEGIECFLQDLHVSGIYFPGLVGGIRLQVLEEDATIALERLKENVEHEQVNVSEDYPQNNVEGTPQGNRLLRWLVSLLGRKT